MSLYSDLATDADGLLREFGQAVTLTTSSPAGYAHGAPTSVTTASYSSTGVEIDYTAREIDGTLIQVGDKKLLLSPYQTNGSAMPLPTSADEVGYGGVVYTVVPPVKAVSPAGTVVLYELQLRGK